MIDFQKIKAMKKKKLGMVVYANPDYYPPTVSAVYLLSQYFDVILIGRNFEPPSVTYPDNVTVHRLGDYSTVRERESLPIQAKLREYFKFIQKSHQLLQGVDCLYLYEPFAFVAGYLYKLRFNRTIPIFYHCHELPEKLFPLSSLTGWVQRLEKLWVNQATEVIQPEQERSEYYQQLMQLKKPPLIVPNFPLSSFFEFDCDWQDLIQKRYQNPIFFYRGAISSNISMTEILRSIKLLSEKLQSQVKVKFTGVLNQHSQKQLDDLVSSLHLKNTFDYLGKLPLYEDVQKVTLSTFLGFCLYKPSSKSLHFTVTSSNKIYEYAGCGLPVIVSDNENYRNFLGKEPWVYFANPDDPQSISAAIMDILSDFDQYQAMCLSARKAFEEKFNYDIVFQPLLEKIRQSVDC
jgi:glycosyltransferase involved in cell wall biosynthesis